VTGLGRQLDQVMAGLAQDAQGTLYIERPPADPRFTTPYGGLYWQIEASGQLLTSRSLWDYTLVLAEDTLPPGRLHVHDLIGPQGEQLLAVERRVTIAHRSGPFTAFPLIHEVYPAAVKKFQHSSGLKRSQISPIALMR
jgi:hypothetical protein